MKREFSVLCRSGDDLLSRVLRHSTIGAEEFNGRVRDGIGFLAPRSNHRTGEGQGKQMGTKTGARAPAPGRACRPWGAESRASLRGLPHRLPRDRSIPPGRPAAAAHSAESPGRRSAPASEATKIIHGPGSGRTWIMRVFKPIERLVPVSSTRCRAYTPGLSTWSSSTALKGVLVSRGVSRLDAFSGYPVRT